MSLERFMASEMSKANAEKQQNLHTIFLYHTVHVHAWCTRDFVCIYTHSTSHNSTSFPRSSVLHIHMIVRSTTTWWMETSASVFHMSTVALRRCGTDTLALACAPRNLVAVWRRETQTPATANVPSMNSVVKAYQIAARLGLILVNAPALKVYTSESELGEEAQPHTRTSIMYYSIL